MTPPVRTAPGLRVIADLELSVTAPDGAAALVRVRDQAGTIVVDIDRPGVVLRSLPAPADRRAIAGLVGRTAPRGREWAARVPDVRVRTRGVTVATARNGRPRPGAIVIAAALVPLAVVVGAVTAVVAVVGAAARRRASRT